MAAVRESVVYCRGDDGNSQGHGKPEGYSRGTTGAQDNRRDDIRWVCHTGPRETGGAQQTGGIQQEHSRTTGETTGWVCHTRQGEAGRVQQEHSGTTGETTGWVCHTRPEEAPNNSFLLADEAYKPETPTTVLQCSHLRVPVDAKILPASLNQRD